MSATTSKSASVPDESSATLDASHASNDVPPQPTSRSDAAGQRTPPNSGIQSAAFSPRKPRAGIQSQAHTLEGLKQNDPAQRRQWADDMDQKFIAVVSAEDLINMLPFADDELEKVPEIVDKCRYQFKKSEKQLDNVSNENDTSGPLLKFLEKVFGEFPPKTRPLVADTHSTVFKPVFKDEHVTRPDITTGRPGVKPRHITKDGWQWIHAGTVFELKLKIDIFNADGTIKDTDEARDALSQLGKSARSLLDTHGGCYVHVIAVFEGRMTRILRFDRGGFIATQAFDWIVDQQFLPKFFYRLYNAKPGHMAGDDDTISVPSEEVKKALVARLRRDEFYKDFPELKDAAKNSLCIKAALFYEEPDSHGKVTRKSKIVNCLTFGPPLSIADGLFGRATQVYRVLLEEDLKDTEGPLAVFALKDAWRQAYRRPELDFYDAIQHHCLNADPPVDMEGMARCCGSVDLAEPSEDWDSALHRTVFLKHERFERRHMRTLLTPVGLPLKNFKSQKALCRALYTVVLHLKAAYEAGVLHRDVSEGNVLLQEASPDKGFLLDWDYAEFTPEGLQKFYAAFEDRDRESYRDIAKSLKDFTGTEPFMAIEILFAQQRLNAQPEDGDGNGIEGSDVAGAADKEGAGSDSEMYGDEGSQLDGSVVHEGTFVASEEADDKMTIVEGKLEDDLAEDGQVIEMDVNEGDNDQGPATAGTTSGPPALEHGPYHDLESVYWLLVWMILRHTTHGHPDGALACVNLFAGKGINAKNTWILRTQFEGKQPLFQLAEDLRDMVLGQYPSPRRLKAMPVFPEYMSHEEVLSIFRKYLRLPWGAAVPTKQYKIPSVEPKKNAAAKAKQTLLEQATANSRGSKAKSAATPQSQAASAASAGSKRGRVDDEQSAPAEPVASGSALRQSKKAKVSKAEVTPQLALRRGRSATKKDEQTAGARGTQTGGPSKKNSTNKRG